MKKFLSILAIAFIVVSCSNDDNATPLVEEISNEEEEPAIIGSWMMTAYILETPNDNNGDGTYSNDFLDELTCLETEFIFKEDGSYERTTMLVIIDNDPPHVWACAEVRTLFGTWRYYGNHFRITDANGSIDTYFYELTDDVISYRGSSNYLRGDYEIFYERQ